MAFAKIQKQLNIANQVRKTKNYIAIKTRLWPCVLKLSFFLIVGVSQIQWVVCKLQNIKGFCTDNLSNTSYKQKVLISV